MAKKKASGQRTFFRVMAVLGVVTVVVLVNEFLSAAPDLSPTQYHTASVPVHECLQCHVQEAEKTTIMPHRPMEHCTFCHHPSKTD